ncbi:MAG: hypothetical protein HYU66_01320 [Armatimonadetes bacterium]|nr:hypothetical protein [Armatimonadota bacterium]
MMDVPRMYRAMRAAEDGRPKVSNTALGLGVRAPGDPGKPDVWPDEDGDLQPGGGGMSVVPEWQLLPPHRRPGHPKTPQDTKVWMMGNGPFVFAAVTEVLQLRPDDEAKGSPEHGVVEPAVVIALDSYRSALAGTRACWQPVDLEGER